MSFRALISELQLGFDGVHGVFAHDRGGRELDGVDGVDRVMDGVNGVMDDVDGGVREADEVGGGVVVGGD